VLERGGDVRRVGGEVFLEALPGNGREDLLGALVTVGVTGTRDFFTIESSSELT
jgi:hypothetical protein